MQFTVLGHFLLSVSSSLHALIDGLLQLSDYTAEIPKSNFQRLAKQKGAKSVNLIFQSVHK